MSIDHYVPQHYLREALRADFELEVLEPTSAKLMRARIICSDAEYPYIDAMEAYESPDRCC